MNLVIGTRLQYMTTDSYDTSLIAFDVRRTQHIILGLLSNRRPLYAVKILLDASLYLINAPYLIDAR